MVKSSSTLEKKLQSKKMGKIFKKNDEFGGRSGKPAKHSSGKKTGGMRTLNSYVEEDYDDYDLNDDSFDDGIELDDEIQIQHNTNTK